ncbi:MAG TPA: T9SS type A sorting domain-containing protein, partial [Ignavibacteria bacterium]|nr:T9SS type A sorting domain-containing protein [Ignavibacteria bacterium]
NYPNPFNPSTKIRYAIPSKGIVTLKVFNTLGKEVAKLVEQFHTPGEYEYTFHASGLSSGIYYYTISSDNFTETKKMVLLK